MSRLIDAGAAYKAACDGADNWDGGCSPYRDDCIREEMDKVPTAYTWNRVEEPPKSACDCLMCWTTIHDDETGEVTGHGFWCEMGWYEDGLLGNVGFYCQSRHEEAPVRVEPDYWMIIEPPKEDV